MNYKQEDLLKDYAKRTVDNLQAIEQLGEDNPTLPTYETTQLINSLLGLIVLPVEQYFDQLPLIPIEELIKQGWKVPKVMGDFPQVKDLCELMMNLRHAVAHFNIQFLVDGNNQIIGLEVWNKHPREKKILWQAEIGIPELRDLLKRFVDLINDPQYEKYRRCSKRKNAQA